MDNTQPNTTPPVPPTPVPVDSKESLKNSFFKSLQLSVEPAVPNPQVPALESNGAPIPDSGVEAPSTIEDFSPSGGSLHEVVRDLKKTPTPEPVVPAVAAEPATPAATPAPTPAPAAPVATTPEPATPPQGRQIKIPELPKPPVDDTVTAPISTLDLNGLSEDEVNEVRTAEFAENRYPQRYTGHAKRVLDYIRKHKDFVSQAETVGPLDEDDQNYQRFVKANKPAVTDSERRRLERERLVDEAVAEAERRSSLKTRKIEEELVQLKAAPIVDRTINDYKSLVKEIMPKTEDDPVLKEAVDKMTGMAVDAGQEFLMLSARLKPYDTKNSTHTWLADFIQEQGTLYVKSGHESLKRNGKTFVPRSQYNAAAPEVRAKHFTFTDEDVLQLLAVNAKAAAEFQSKMERERMEKMGYARRSTPAPSPVPVTSDPEPSPRASASVTAPSAPLAAPRTRDPFLQFMQGGK